jgi:SlyX protein
MTINNEVDEKLKSGQRQTTQAEAALETKFDDKIQDFEYQLAFQEETIDQLNDRIWQQQQQIDLLEKAVKRLAHDFKQGDSSQPEIIDTPPPHY